MVRGFWGLMVLCGAMTAFCGCSEPGPKRPPSVEASGTVNLDGKPLEDGEISLMVSGQPDMRIPIKDGKFSGKALTGENSVRIFAYKTGEPIMMDGKPFGEPQKVNYIAPEFSDSSTLKTTVAAGGSKDLKFDVKAKEATNAK
ncbi:MAG: hypothetical protein U0941_02200 [Planctomycetaceae bacterium]